MDPGRQEHVVDEQLARLVGMAERRQHRARKTTNRGVIDTHGLMVQIANLRRIGVVSDPHPTHAYAYAPRWHCLLPPGNYTKRRYTPQAALPPA